MYYKFTIGSLTESYPGKPERSINQATHIIRKRNIIPGYSKSNENAHFTFSGKSKTTYKG